MNNTTHSMIEVTIGAILFGLGIIYLNAQYTTLDRMASLVKDKVIESESVYQQNKEELFHTTSYEELYSIIMGYREYPIIIDGHYFENTSFQYDEIFTHIRKGIYNKQYQFDENHNIKCISYVYVHIS